MTDHGASASEAGFCERAEGMRTVLSWLTALMLVVSAVGLVLGGHYVKALANQFRDGVHKVVPAETHAEAGQVAIQESEDELVKAHLAMSKELESVPEKEAELTKLQQSEAELVAKLELSKSLLKTEMVDSKDLPGLSNDVELLVTALKDVRSKKTDLLRFLQGLKERHAKFTRDARELLDKLDNAKLKLAEGVAKQHSEQAKALLAKANQSAEKLKGLTTFLVDRSEVLEQIRTPQLSDQMSTTHTVENLINVIDVALK
jgi:hypothetical protein